MAMAIPIMMLAGTAVSMYGTYRQGQSQAADLEYQAKVQEHNAALARRQAEIEGAQTAQREYLVRQKARAVLGMQRAGMAEAGIVGIGSALDVHGASVMAAEVDALNVRHEGTLRRLSMLEEASMKDTAAEMLRASAKETKKAAMLSMLGQGMQGAGAAMYMGATMPKSIGTGTASYSTASTGINASQNTLPYAAGQYA